MQTITGKLRESGGDSVHGLALFFIQHRIGKSPGTLVTSITTDENGDFSFSLFPGQYFLVVGSDKIPFLVKENSGTSNITNLIEEL